MTSLEDRRGHQGRSKSKSAACHGSPDVAGVCAFETGLADLKRKLGWHLEGGPIDISAAIADFGDLVQIAAAGSASAEDWAGKVKQMKVIMAQLDLIKP